VIYLKIDEKTLCERVLKQTDNDYGRSGHERQRILDREQSLDNQHSGSIATTIDATKPLEEVADTIEQVIEYCDRLGLMRRRDRVVQGLVLLAGLSVLGVAAKQLKSAGLDSIEASPAG